MTASISLQSIAYSTMWWGKWKKALLLTWFTLEVEIRVTLEPELLYQAATLPGVSGMWSPRPGTEPRAIYADKFVDAPLPNKLVSAKSCYLAPLITAHRCEQIHPWHSSVDVLKLSSRLLVSIQFRCSSESLQLWRR